MTRQTASAVPRVRWHRIVLVLLAVPAILFGLLAMHGITTSSMGGSQTPMAVPDQATGMVMHAVGSITLVAMNSDSPLRAQNCEGACGPDHAMLGMACVLALLFTVLLFALHPVLSRREGIRRKISALAAKVSTLAPPTPPSLHCLSISRT
jgi:hypothetical protein